MSEIQNSKVVNLDERLALKKLLDDISDDELETAKKYIEALHKLTKKSDNKPKG